MKMPVKISKLTFLELWKLPKCLQNYTNLLLRKTLLNIIKTLWHWRCSFMHPQFHGILATSNQHTGGTRRLPVIGMSRTHSEHPEPSVSGHCHLWLVLQLPGNNNSHGMCLLELIQSFPQDNLHPQAIVKRQWGAISEHRNCQRQQKKPEQTKSWFKRNLKGKGEEWDVHRDFWESTCSENLEGHRCMQGCVHI